MSSKKKGSKGSKSPGSPRLLRKTLQKASEDDKKAYKERLEKKINAAREKNVYFLVEEKDGEIGPSKQGQNLKESGALSYKAKHKGVQYYPDLRIVGKPEDVKAFLNNNFFGNSSEIASHMKTTYQPTQAEEKKRKEERKAKLAQAREGRVGTHIEKGLTKYIKLSEKVQSNEKYKEKYSKEKFDNLGFMSLATSDEKETDRRVKYGKLYEKFLKPQKDEYLIISNFNQLTTQGIRVEKREPGAFYNFKHDGKPTGFYSKLGRGDLINAIQFLNKYGKPEARRQFKEQLETVFHISLGK